MKPESEPIIWAVTFTEFGRISGEPTKCKVEKRSTSARVYVRARTAAEAKGAAKERRTNLLNDEKRERNQAAGLCRCGRELDGALSKRTRKPLIRCPLCREREAAYDNRQRAKSAGRPVPPAAAPLTLEERKKVRPVHEDAFAKIRLKVLLEVQGEWQTCGANVNFTRWLKEQIARAS